MDELQLNGNEEKPIVKMGNNVHRPTYWWTPSIHHLLDYLESVGFPYSPRVVGFDDRGREILTFIEGESGKEGWLKILSDDGLANYARFLKNYHEVISNYIPPKDAQWAYASGTTQPGEIMCHGDFGPWNIVWQGNKPVGILDWDFVLPAKPSYDILYALEYSTPFRDDETALKWHHFSHTPDRKHRIELFLEAYGTSLENITDGVIEVQRKGIQYVKELANRGVRPQLDWMSDGTIEMFEKQVEWTENNRSLFE